MLATALVLLAAASMHPHDVGEPQERARARVADLASYVSPSDYPTLARRNAEEGTTGFRLDVGANGRVTNCVVISSSGSSALDNATCRIMRSRARFTPARDAAGNQVADTFESQISWSPR